MSWPPAQMPCWSIVPSREAVTTAMDELAGLGVPFGGYANAFTSVAALEPGGTVDVLEARKDLDPSAYAEHVLQWVQKGQPSLAAAARLGPPTSKPWQSD